MFLNSELLAQILALFSGNLLCFLCGVFLFMGSDASSDSGESSKHYGLHFHLPGNANLTIVIAVVISCFMLAILVLLRFLICKDCGGSEGVRRSRSVRNNISVKNSCHGLGKEDMDRLPILSYSALLRTRGGNRVASDCCAVCLGDFLQTEEKIKLLPSCKHGFHPECIDMWLYSHTSCPICRTSLVEEDNNPKENSDVVIAMPLEEISSANLQRQA